MSENSKPKEKKSTETKKATVLFKAQCQIEMGSTSYTFARGRKQEGVEMEMAKKLESEGKLSIVAIK